MTTRTSPRQHSTRRTQPRVRLTEPPVIEGECPNRHCRATYVLTEAGQVPEHARTDMWTRRHRCPCSGWLARNPRPRPYFHVEGVHFL